MTQPDPHHSLALFRDSLIVDFVPVPASSKRRYVRWRDQARGSRAALAAYLVEPPQGHDPNGGFAAGASAEHFPSSLKRAAALPA